MSSDFFPLFLSMLVLKTPQAKEGQKGESSEPDYYKQLNKGFAQFLSSERPLPSNSEIQSFQETYWHDTSFCLKTENMAKHLQHLTLKTMLRAYEN